MARSLGLPEADASVSNHIVPPDGPSTNHQVTHRNVTADGRDQCPMTRKVTTMVMALGPLKTCGYHCL
jgi:hypothetical protein